MSEAQGRSHRMDVVFGILGTLILTALSLLAVAFLGGGANPGGDGFPSSFTCTVPKLPGTVVNVSLTNTGEPMMGPSNGMMHGGAMRLGADRATAPRGTVSFLVTNNGSVNHEMVVLPLLDSQIAGTRQNGGDAKVDETGSLGEAAATCGEAQGQGILPGGSSWVTLTLAPGRYELVCNLPGHYAAGMYGQLTIP